jgi:hypothetical protein
VNPEVESDLDWGFLVAFNNQRADAEYWVGLGLALPSHF